MAWARGPHLLLLALAALTQWLPAHGRATVGRRGAAAAAAGEAHVEHAQRQPQDAAAAVGGQGKNKIPHILHYIYLSGYKAYEAETERPDARMAKWQYDSCVKVHPHWKVMFWTEQMAHDLVSTHFPDFLPIWSSYDLEVNRADAIRAFILLHHGGMYLDLDNECYTPAERLFKDYDVVLQGTGFEGVNNGMMASAPGHPMWHKLVEVLRTRYKGSTSDPWKNNPIYMTGPGVLTTTVQHYLKIQGPVPGFIGTTFLVEGTKVRIYSLGEFFVPCWGSDLLCIKRFETEKALGRWNMTNIAGRHWFAGSWNKPWLISKNMTNEGRRLQAAPRRVLPPLEQQ